MTTPRTKPKKYKKTGGCDLEFASMTTLFEKGPVRFDVKEKKADLPLVYASDCELPSTIRACFAIFDKSRLDVAWTVCEDEASKRDGRYGAAERASNTVVSLWRCIVELERERRRRCQRHL